MHFISSLWNSLKICNAYVWVSKPTINETTMAIANPHRSWKQEEIKRIAAYFRGATPNHFPRRCSRNCSSPFKINQSPPRGEELSNLFRNERGVGQVVRRRHRGEDSFIYIVLVRAISHGRRFWPITLTRLTGIYPERECAHYRFHTVADILDLVRYLRTTILFWYFIKKKNDTRVERRRGVYSRFFKCNRDRQVFSYLEFEIDRAFERFSLKDTVKYL